MGTFRQKVQATTGWVPSAPEDMAETPKKKGLLARLRKADSEADGAEVASVVQASAPVRKKRKAPPPPVTAHRLFPAFAAIWFAALLSLGSLAVSSEVLGALVVKLGLPALVPAAAPPLGFTARLLLAFALGIAGGAFGLVLGLRLRGGTAAGVVVAAAPDAEPEEAAASSAAGSYKVRARDAHPDAPPRRPLVLTEAFADPLDEALTDAFEEPDMPLLRRKPGAAPAQEAAEEPAPWIPEFTPGGREAVQPLDLALLDLTDPIEPAPISDGDGEPASAQTGVQLQVEADHAGAEEAGAEQAAPAPEAMDAAAAVSPPAAPTLIAATPQMPAGYVATLPEVPHGTWSPVAGAPLESLGLVQLIERLALAMAARTAADDADQAGADQASAEQPVEPEFAPGPFSMPQPAKSPATAALPGSGRESILRRLSAMAASDLATSDGAPPFSRPAATPVSSVPAEDVREAVVQLRAEPLGELAAERIAPAFAAPASTAVPFETDEALRSALATLQRMTARA